METTKAKTADAEKLRINEKKWTKPLMDAGWSAFHNIIIEKKRSGLPARSLGSW